MAFNQFYYLLTYLLESPHSYRPLVATFSFCDLERCWPVDRNVRIWPRL